ncbi:hypothetical protein JTB14_014384 [Gonioctena quinquepunctata]|nr:hypothetical protein JTB14_014384 [Gonioctena quinquepunctata]
MTMKRMIRVNSRHRKNNNDNDRIDPNSWKNKANVPREETLKIEDVLQTNRRKTTIKIVVWLALASILLVAVILISIYCSPANKNISNKEQVTPPGPNSCIKLPNHQFLKRDDWGARPPKSLVKVTKPVNMVIIKHTHTRTCDSFIDCVSVVATRQSQDARDGRPDISFNFLIGGDGNVYEGRGWGVQPQQRNDTIDIAYIGTYDIDELTPSMIDAAKVLLKDGMKRKYLTDNYIIVCHNQTEPDRMSPGQNIYREVKTWPHYDPGIYFEKPLEMESSASRCLEKL